jgi:GDP-D-mannose dehydratase
MTSFDEIENIAKRCLQSKRNKQAEWKTLAGQIIDYISSANSEFSLQKGSMITNETTSYLYHNGTTYPNLFEFISEILHSEIPITVNKARFGPGEIIVSTGDQDEANKQLALSIKELRKLVHAKRAEIIRS